MLKYKLTSNSIEIEGITLYQIQKISNNSLGGYLESEKNLSQKGECFLDIKSYIMGNSKLLENVILKNTQIKEDTKILGTGKITNCSLKGKISLNLKGDLIDSSLQGSIKIDMEQPSRIENSTLKGLKSSLLIKGTKYNILNSSLNSSTLNGLNYYINNSIITNMTIKGSPSIEYVELENSLIRDNPIIKGDPYFKSYIKNNCKIIEKSIITGKFQIEDDVLIAHSTRVNGLGSLKISNKVIITINSVISAMGIIRNSIKISNNSVILGEVLIENNCTIIKESILYNAKISNNVKLRSSAITNDDEIYGPLIL